ncbi:MAG: DNA polymerase III subunit alpha, partial [Candidatus Hydrogenedentes bacterium]|nr:DNA polymerase III subunit alpha [Candidatus Hydrogenedentota bacterium]
LGLVATNDAHYLKREDSYAHEVLLCIQTGTTLDDERRMRFETDEFYLRSPDEMARVFAEWPESISNTGLIAERCNVEIPLGQRLIPRYEPPPGKTDKEYLEQLIDKGLHWRYGADVPAEVRDRVAFELDVIERMGFVGYFLVVWDFVNAARERGIPVGPGRGSAAGSMVSYALGITNLDPIRYGLLFERFLNPDRVSMPDIDIDFCYERRGEIIDYVTHKYGADCVSMIITFGTLGARMVLRDVGRVLGIEYGRVDKVAKLIPGEPNITLADAIKKEPALKQLVETESDIGHMYKTACLLEGLVRNVSTHAAGVVISDTPLAQHVPLYRARGDESEAITTQWPMKAVEKTGLLKMDFLGLRTLTVIHDTLELVKHHRGIEIDLDNLPLDDKPTFSLLNQGKTVGVFQLESQGMRDLATQMGVDSIEDIGALVALYRPGPLNMRDEFVGRKQGKIPVEYDHPLLEPVLKETCGVMLYQEQVMETARVIGGFTLGEADLLRRAMGKKNVEQMAKLGKKFIDGAVARNIDPQTAERIFSLMKEFAGYGFNKSHSAAYALIAYQTAYLKANYPAEFMAATLSSFISSTDKLPVYINECKQLDIEMLPPDINASRWKFTVENGKIRFGLGAVKNVGHGAIENVLAERDATGPFLSLFDLCSRVDMKNINRRMIESLIKAGAFDCTGAHRNQMYQAVNDAIARGNAAQRERDSGQTTLFDTILGDSPVTSGNELPDAPEWTEKERLAFEKEALGLYVSGHPLAQYERQIKLLVSADAKRLQHMADGEHVVVGGIVTSVRVTSTRRGNRMAVVTVEDLADSFEVVAFSEVFETARELIEPDNVIVVEGSVNRRDNRASVRADTIVAIDNARARLARSAHLRLPANCGENGLCEQIVETVRGFSGTMSLYVHYEVDGFDAVVRASDKLRIRPTDECVDAITELIGCENMWFSSQQ